MTQNFNEFHSQQDGGAECTFVLLLGQYRDRAKPLLVLTIAAALLALVLGFSQFQEKPGLALGFIVIGVGLSWVAYRLHRRILYITGDCLVIPSQQLHRGHMYTVVYRFHLQNQTIDLNELAATAKLQCLQNSVHHSSKSVRTTLSQGVTRRRIVSFKDRGQEMLHVEAVLAQTIERKPPRVEASFVLQIPKWLPSSGPFGQHPMLQGSVQWSLEVAVRKQHRRHHTFFVLEVGAPKAL